MNDKVNILLKEYELHRSELKMRIDHRLRGFTFFFLSNFSCIRIGAEG